MKTESDRIRGILCLAVLTAALAYLLRRGLPLLLVCLFIREISYRSIVWPPAFRATRTDIFIRI